MQKCKRTDCKSNRDGYCMGSWDECPAMGSQLDSRGVAMTLILIVILGILCFAYFSNYASEPQIVPEVEAVVPTVTQVPSPEVKHGQYTIFHYTPGGWVNTLYVTDYYITDQIIYYKSREHQAEYMEVPLEDCFLQPGWIEDADELVEYGYWEYAEEDYSYE